MIRIILAISTQFGWSIYHLDMKITFLNGEILEEVYVSQPKHYENLKQKNDVNKLQKALYSLKRTPTAWYFELEKSLISLGKKKTEFEHAPLQVAA